MKRITPFAVLMLMACGPIDSFETEEDLEYESKESDSLDYHSHGQTSCNSTWGYARMTFGDYDYGIEFVPYRRLREIRSVTLLAFGPQNGWVPEDAGSRPDPYVRTEWGAPYEWGIENSSYTLELSAAALAYNAEERKAEEIYYQIVIVARDGTGPQKIFSFGCNYKAPY